MVKLSLTLFQGGYIVEIEVGLKKVKDYQLLIDNHIRKLGGYWRSISALARLHEEMGELGELLLEQPLDNEEVGAELADIYVISTCIANQYLNDLHSDYKMANIPNTVPELLQIRAIGDLKDIYLKAMIYCGRIARIINHYEGDKVKKPNEKIMRLGEEIPQLHKLIVCMANHLELNLFDYIDKVLEKSAKRDKNRFGISHDPVTESSLERFASVIKNTSCSFAFKAKVWGSYEWSEQDSLKDNIKNSFPSFLRFTKSCHNEGLDGYVFEIKNTSQDDSIAGLKKALYNTLKILSDWDPAKEHSLEGDIHNPNWQFSFNGIRLFTTTFASFYPKDHPRYSPHKGSYFIFMQPEFSFDKHGIHKENKNREKIKEGIRKNFKKTGGYYDVDLIKQPIEALKYIKPISEQEEPVKWW